MSVRVIEDVEDEGVPQRRQTDHVESRAVVRFDYEAGVLTNGANDKALHLRREAKGSSQANGKQRRKRAINIL